MTDAPDVVRTHYASTDLGEVEQFLCTNYTDVSLRLTRERDGFRFGHDTVTAGAVTMNRLFSTRAFEADAAALEDIVVSDLRRGELAWTTRRHGTVQSVAGGVGLSPTTGEYRAAVEPSDLDMVVLDTARVADYAAHTCGIAPEALDFTALTPLSPGLARYWRATVEHVRTDILDDPVMVAHPIVVESAFRSLVAVLLSTFPNTALDAATDPAGRDVPGDVGEVALRDVVDYLDAHAREPLGPADVAGVADAPYRDVVAGLHRHHDTHPALLLWRVRLRGARLDLDTGDPGAGDTVAAIAARWGFDDLRTFQVAYTMATGGETPERTLGR